MPLKIGVILGSTRPNRAGEAVAQWFMKQTESYKDVEFQYIDLRDVNLPFFDESIPPLMGQYEHEHTKQWAKTIDALDGFIVVTPEYNHSFPAVLKNAFDFVSKEWNRKAIGFVSYGATSGGIRAVEQLRLVAAELQMASIREQVSIPFIWAAFEGAEPKERAVFGDPKTLIDEVLWWSEALKTARTATQAKK